MGTEPHRSRRSRSAGVATVGVALQGPANNAKQGSSVQSKEGSVQARKQCASKDGCKGGSVQALST